MIRLSFFLACIFVSASACAEWVKLTVDDEQVKASDESYYVDPVIDTTGPWPQIHTLRNYGAQDRKGNYSDRMICEVNCVQKTLRAIGGAFYQDLMGHGEFTLWNRQTPWVSPAPNSALQSVMHYVCEKQDDH